MGMDLYVYQVSKIDKNSEDTKIFLFEPDAKIEKKLKKCNIPFLKGTELFKKDDDFKNFLKKEFNLNITDENFYSYLDKNLFYNLNSSQKIFKDLFFIIKTNSYFKKRDTEIANKECSVETFMSYYEEFLQEIKNELESKEKNKIIETKFGSAYVFDKNNLKVSYTDFIYFYVEEEELYYFRKPFQWKITPPKVNKDTIIISVDNFTGCDEEKLEQLKAEIYWNDEYGSALITNADVLAKKLLVDLVKPEIKNEIQKIVNNMTNQEVFYFSW